MSVGRAPRCASARLVTAVALLLGALMGVPAAAQAAQSSAPVLRGYELIGHRGSSTPDVTENTLPAFDAARAHGATAVELDVRMSKDRRFVVMHDKRLDRTTTCTGRVDLRTWRSIRDRCRGERGRERIPALHHVLGWAGRNDTNLLVELKANPVQWGPEDFSRLTSQVRASGVASRVRYLSTAPDLLHGVRTADPSAALNAIALSATDIEALRSWADAIHAAPRHLTPELVSSLHRQGVAVIGRVSNSTARWTALRDLGVDGLLTDDLEGYQAWAAG